MTHTRKAHGAGQSTPTRDEARVTSASQVEDQRKGDSADCAALDADRKAIATMKAQAARAGCSLHELAGGGFLLCRWGMSKELPCLRAVGDLLRRIGGSHG